jgi:hypothetical protein
MVAIWNLVILSDRYIFGFRTAGYLSFVMCGCFAAVFLTAPLGYTPGKWLVRDPVFAYRWRWVSWWLALLLALLFLRGSYVSIWGNGPSREDIWGEGTRMERHYQGRGCPVSVDGLLQ